MEPVVRTIRPEEAPAFRRSVMVPFLDPFAGDPTQVADQEMWAAKSELDRAWVVDTGEGFAGNSLIYSMDVTLPAAPGLPCPTVPMAGVSAVGVHPTHRRRGYLRQLMAAMHADARSRGEPLAGLEASESLIYGRFGYGLAATIAQYRINTRESAFTTPAPPHELTLLDRDGAARVLPEIFDRQRRTRAGEPARSPGYWAQLLADPPHQREGLSARFHVVGNEGYALYRSGLDGNAFRGERATITVEELRGTTPGVEASLWRFLLDLDLVGEVTVRRRPLDEPLRWRLADPRQLRLIGVEDRLYVRVLDTVAVVEARGYQAGGRLVVDVVPPTTPEEGDEAAVGRWVLEVGPDGSSCRRAGAGEGVDIRLGLPALGTLLMGGFAASLLAAGGAVEELRAGSVAVADAVLTTRPSPLSGTDF